MPGYVSLKAESSIILNRKLESVRASTHPCLTPLETWKSSSSFPFTYPALMPSQKHCIICTILGGIPVRGRIRHRPGRGTVSKAFCEVNEEDVKILVLLFPLLLDLSGTEYHVNCTSVFCGNHIGFWALSRQEDGC
jgi:hypothetical protein